MKIPGCKKKKGTRKKKRTKVVPSLAGKGKRKKKGVTERGRASRRKNCRMPHLKSTTQRRGGGKIDAVKGNLKGES